MNPNPAQPEACFTASQYETHLLLKIAARATAMRAALGIQNDTLTTLMDVEATHCNGCPLKLDALLSADDFNFAHDVFGIERHIDRETGKLTGHFLPRFALPQSERAA